MILYLTLCLCAAGATAIVCKHDLYDREPMPLLGVAAFLGAGAMWLAGQIEMFTFQTGYFTNVYAIAAVASLEEEFLKVLVVVLMALVARRHFNDPMDGLVYGSMSGLGMAVEESASYMSLLPSGSLLLPPEELVRVSGHLVMGGIGGCAVGWAMLRLKGWRIVTCVCFAAAVTLHFGWDWIVLSSADSGMPGATIWLSVSFMLSGLLLYGSVTAIASEKSRARFAPDRSSRLWGWPFKKR
jgi:RsiW-degrading membrane proteinase PrsW (M82 family)